MIREQFIDAPQSQAGKGGSEQVGMNINELRSGEHIVDHSAELVGRQDFCWRFHKRSPLRTSDVIVAFRPILAYCLRRQQRRCSEWFVACSRREIMSMTTRYRR